MRFLLLALAGVVLLGCSDTLTTTERVDPTLQLTREDFKSLRDTSDVADAGPPIPSLPLKLMDEKELPRIASDKILSISVTEKVPLKDVLMELASKANVDVEVDPRIQGGVNFTATRQNFPTVLKRLCRVAGLRYSVEEGVVRVEMDEPFLKTYNMDYLALARRSQSQIGIATNVFASVQNVTRNGVTSLANQDAQNGNNSLTKVDTSGEADFWPELEANIESILTNTRGARGFRTADGSVARELGLTASKPFSVNRQAGLISVYATKNQQEAVSGYLDRVRRSSKAQVLIEARIVEVQLDENYKAGINWRTVLGGALNAATRLGPTAAAAPFITPTTATNGVVTLSLDTGDFAGILNFVKGFGTTRTLSSPRLTVLNNQPAVLKVARNEVYFTSTVESTPIVPTGGGTPVAVSRTVNSTPNTVPVGFLMNVQPAINLENNEVTLNLRPTVSFIVDKVEDPGVKIAAADANVPEVSSTIPVVAVREMDSVLTLPSGTVAVMGGLMQDSSGNIENGIPGFEEIPLLGNLAKSKDQTGRVSELVILLRATIVDGAPQPDQKDHELYKRYTRDRHPLTMNDVPMPDSDAEPALPPVPQGRFIPAGYKPQGANPYLTNIGFTVERKKPPQTTEQKPKPKKKKRKKKRGASNPVSPMEVAPTRPAPQTIPPTVVPQYDNRPDTFQDD